MTTARWGRVFRHSRVRSFVGFLAVFLALLVAGGTPAGAAQQGEAFVAQEPVLSPVSSSFALQELLLLKTGTVQQGQTSFTLLRKAGVSAAEIIKLRRTIRPLYDIRHLRVGQPYRLEVTPHGVLQRFVYEIDAQQQLEVERQGQTFVGRLIPIVYESRERVLHGTIHGSLYGALASQEETARVATDLADIFAWDVDFHTDLRDGDTFRLLIEERYRGGKFVGYHRILAVELVNRRRVLQAVYYSPDGKDGAYYRPDGSAMRRMFLRSPLRYTRISSRFSRRRFHPVLKRYRPHLGIDYAAPIGAPVRSVGDGTVIWAGRKGASGKMVKIRHNGVYTTYYMHLSRFARSVRVGKRVTQGQIIGYVGSTGLSTGPHLDFRMTKHGKYLNPLRHKNRSAPPLPHEVLPAFRAYAKQLLGKLSALAGTKQQLAASMP